MVFSQGFLHTHPSHSVLGDLDAAFVRHDLSGILCCLSRTIIVWGQSLPQLFALVRMILCSWMTRIPCFQFDFQEDAMPSRTRRFHLHWSHLLDTLWRMVLPLMFPSFYAVRLPLSTQDYHRPPSKLDALVSCHRFIKRYLSTMRMRSRRRMRVLQHHIFSNVVDTLRSWDSIPQALIRHWSVLRALLQPWCQPQRGNREHASVAIGKGVVTKLRAWMT